MKTFILLSVLAGLASAQSGSDRADPVIQSAEFFEHARTLRAGCDYAEAERWLRRAQNIVRHNHMRAGETDAAGNLAARIEIEIAGLHDLQKRLDREQQAITRLIDQKRWAQARQHLQQVGFPRCDSRFETLKQQIAAAQYRADHPPHCDACRKVAKLAIWSAIAGGVGYGGWQLYDRYGRQQTPGSVPRSSPR